MLILDKFVMYQQYAWAIDVLYAAGPFLHPHQETSSFVFSGYKKKAVRGKKWVNYLKRYYWIKNFLYLIGWGNFGFSLENHNTLLSMQF